MPASPSASGEDVLHAGPAGYAQLTDLLAESLEAVGAWMSTFGEYAAHPSLDVPVDTLREQMSDLHARLQDNYPFFHPRYAGQMLKPPHPAAIVGYLSAMLINPNNHALDGGPATAALEKGSSGGWPGCSASPSSRGTSGT
jgi:hypothetical protein